MEVEVKEEVGEGGVGGWGGKWLGWRLRRKLEGVVRERVDG